MRTACFLDSLRLICVCVVLLLCLTACASHEETPAGAILSAMLSCEEGCPAGEIYTRSAEEGEEGYLSESLCSALYGDGRIPAEWALVSDYAIFLTAAEHPFELAVFRCNSSDGTEEVAELCARRLAVLRNYWRGSDCEAYTSGGRVVILGNYVLMLVSSNAEAALEEARTAIG